MRIGKLFSLLVLASLAACSAGSVTGVVSPIDPTNPAGVYRGISADGVLLPAQQTPAADASGTRTTVQINTSSLSLGADGTLGVSYQYTLTRVTASGANSVQNYSLNYGGNWGFNGSSLLLSLYDPFSGTVIQFPATVTPTGVTVTTDFGVLIGVPAVFRVLYQP